MICEFGDVVVVPFPFVERPISKRRPALVFSTRAFNTENDHSALAMISQAPLRRGPPRRTRRPLR
ncbi:MAG: type II toxin-antitoxin system PemK/MazF family toxin, partial [Cucumibacter sp.]